MGTAITWYSHSVSSIAELTNSVCVITTVEKKVNTILCDVSHIPRFQIVKLRTSLGLI